MPLYAPAQSGALYAEDPQAANAVFDGAFGPQGSPFPAPVGMGAGPIQLPDPGSLDLGATPKVKRPGLLGRIKQQPGGSKALLALGASLLSSQNFFDGLGKGVMAYQNTLDAEADKLKPQLTKDATFSYSRDPTTGEMVFNRTPVADFEDSITDRKLESARAMSKYRTDANVDLGRDKLAENGRQFDVTAQHNKDVLAETARYHDASLRNAYDIAKLNNQTSLMEKQLAAGGKPPPAQIQKQVGDYQDIVQKSDTTLSQAQPIMQALSNGTLQLGIAANLSNKAKLATGVGIDDSAVLYGQLNTFIEGLRNTILMDARGVQTDGDAERAKAALLSGTGSNESVMRNLSIVLNNLKGRRDFAAARAGDLSSQYGIETPQTNAVLGIGGGAPQAPAPRQTPRAGQTSSGAKWRIVG